MFALLFPVIAVMAVVLIISSGYVKAPTDTAYIISGLRKKPKVLIGQAGIKIPFLERMDKMILKQISIDIKTDGFIPTNDFIGVNIDAVAKVRVLTQKDVTVGANGELLPCTKEGDGKWITEDMVNAAMKNFLNLKEEAIRTALTDSLQGNMREIIGTQTLKDLCNNRKGFGDEVQAKAQKDMNALGIWIESCNIQKIEDERGLINALGQDNMSKIQKDASIAKAKADSEVAIEQAKAKQAANDAEVAAQEDIAKKQNQLEITKADLKIEADKKKAEADAAYKIQEQTQRRSIEVEEANANIARQEREIELKAKEVEVRERELDANVRKQAEAEKYAKEQAAEADLFERQKKAEAELFEEQKKAEARKAQAEADAYAEKQKAEAVKALGDAEAAAIRAKGTAEAEAMDKKAEAYAKYNNAAVAEMMIGVLPEIAAKIAEPLTQIDKITIIGGGDGGNGVDQVAGNVPLVMKKLFDSVKETTGIDLANIVNAESYDAKVTRNVNITGLESECLPEAVAAVITEEITEVANDDAE